MTTNHRARPERGHLMSTLTIARGPRVLDLCCCQGGAGTGYHRAGYDVYGIDITNQPRYPFPFLRMDGLTALRLLLAGHRLPFTRPDGTVELLGLADFDAIHASPPCQGYTRGNAGKVTAWPKLIPDFRALLILTGLPYVIENVKDAGPHMVDPVALCGCMFDLSTIDTDGVTIHLQRLRLFESNAPLTAPRACDHSAHQWVAGAYGGARRDKYEAKYVPKGGYVPRSKDVVKRLLGIEHDMTWNGLFESVPPTYTEHVGAQLRARAALSAVA
jgi:DNA (cytosine-5)-methyltransferase 1